MPTQRQKADTFRALHERDTAFVIPNPWDVGSARLLSGLGFEALATTSAGFAHSIGRMDGEVARDEKLAHCEALCAATDVPISADLENGYSDDPATAAQIVTLAARSGLVGGSIEDYCPTGEGAIYEFEHAVERVVAAVEVARGLDFPFVLTARAEGLIRGERDLEPIIRRLQAFEAAGADVLYAPGLRTLEQLRQVASEVSKPLNVLAPPFKGASVDELSQAGATRISLGGALARAVLATLIEAGEQMLGKGTFDWTRKVASDKQLSALFEQ
ncbi:MAG: isocitrate lyase/phosphoenolpyruvate mutase family protein [Gammaproteobacteria bacterium]|nr:isocitrate lyase/phosphoenolpyruvate mutase family protein [Gammaproteobacteria bacterium]